MRRSAASIRDLASAVRGRRGELGLSQAQLASRAQVSRQWISEFETGKPAAELRLVLRVLDAVGLTITLDDGSSDEGGAVQTAVDLDAHLADYAR